MEIVIIVILILLNGILAMSEIALVSSRKSKFETEAKKGNRSAQTALKLAEEPDRFLSTIQIGITLIGILTGLYSGEALADDLAVWVAYIPSFQPCPYLKKGCLQIFLSFLVIFSDFGRNLPR